MKQTLDMQEECFRDLTPHQEPRRFLKDLFRDVYFEGALQLFRHLMTERPQYVREMYHDSLVYLIAFLRDLCGIIRHLGWPGGDI